MREIWIIAFNVFRQLLRNRILVVLTLFALSLVGVVVFLGDLGQEAETRLGQDFGMLAIEWVGFFSVLLCHVVLLFEETELKTLSILLVKPIERWQYLGGKILGSVLLMLMNQGVMVLLLLGLSWHLHLHLVDGDFLAATAYLALGGALLSTVAGLFGVLASSVPAAAVFTTFAFTLGHFTANLLEWVQRLDSPLLKWVVRLLYWILPNFSLFNLKENLNRIGAVPAFSSVFLWPMAYGLLYGGIMFALAKWSYDRKEF
jgi:ABC-type Na+ efflux pump permease subunit